MTVSEYVANINERYQTGISREHSYRGDLQALLESILEDVLVTNEPARIECGAPDYILTKKGIPVGYIEAKDIDEPLTGEKHKEQFDRYKESLPNLIITDYLDFHLYQEEEHVTSIRIAETDGDSIKPKPNKFKEFQDLLHDFATHEAQTITSSSKLSKMMAGKARLLSNIIENALKEDEHSDSSSADSSLRDQLEAFQDVLIHDIDAEEFADIYAQTIAYGMFAARLHDPTLESFSRQEAAQLIPKTNPFLRKLFQYIAGYDLDERIDWIVDALADIFRATDVAALLKDFGKATQQNDPIIHFYETFLAEFDPSLRKSRGVWYTPEPVVNFIVRAVDDILIDSFDLSDGLADTQKTKIKVNTDVQDNRSSTGYRQEEKKVHKVQILDPAAGTGTFLAEVINQIYDKFEGQQGVWQSYVENHLIPRLNGFEILMASYAMAHLKLDMLLRDTGYKRESNQRFRVYLTNSLEEHHPNTGTFFASWLSQEANEANYVKRDTPVMVVIGNPPYSVSSSNKSDWIQNLVKDYKKNLTAQNIQPLSDDYIKFIRFGQHFIEKNGEGVLAYISNNTFIDGLIHKQMRKSLLGTFDRIYILDLHGNYKKREKTEEGTKDENVFDIQQGVSINLFIKNSELNESGVWKYDVKGTRQEKYNLLRSESLKSLDWTKIKPTGDKFFFKDVDNKLKERYKNYISLNDLFKERGAGTQTKRDSLFIDFDKAVLEDRIERLLNGNLTQEEKSDLNISNSSSYPLLDKIEEQEFSREFIREYNYRIFDDRYIYYDKDLLGRAFYNIMRHMLKPNIGLITCKQQSSFDFQHCFVTEIITDHNSISLQTKEASYFFPLYIYPEDTNQQTIEGKPSRSPNFNPKPLKKFSKDLSLNFVTEDNDEEASFSPIDILDYIYATLHSPTYREKYKEFLKVDYPRIPKPKSDEDFLKLAEIGRELRNIHLLKHPVVDDFITTFPVGGSNKITKRLTNTEPGFIKSSSDNGKPTKTDKDSRYPDELLGKVQINGNQYFGNVPQKAWNYYLGGFKVAERWLKERRDRKLSYEEIQRFQKIVVAIMETDRLMKRIDSI